MVEAAKLDKSARDALPDEHFAVPDKRKLPINDERHTRLAWDQLDRTQGLTPEEKSTARSRIMHRADELGIDTADWHKMKAMRIEAMALNIETDDGHPNKLPFKGVLTRVGEASDAAPSGSGGRRVMLTQAAAEQAIPSLLGMAVNYQPDFSGHDPKAKIGIITAANIVGTAIEIEGFIYAADFPEVAERIRQDKDALGFSFEAQRIYIADPRSDPIEIVECVFTGAAILRKDKAAYQTTSLAASADQEIDMTQDELKATLSELLAGALKPLDDRLAKIEEDSKARIDASVSTMSMVEPHAAALESCAGAMETAGVGLHAQNGHVAVMRRMAGSMRAEAAVGKIPHVFRDHDYPMSAAADHAKDDEMDEKKLAAVLEAAMKPVLDKLAAQDTMIADLKASARREATPPERKTVSPSINALLAKAMLTVPDGDGKLATAEVDKALSNANLSTLQRIQVKTELSRAGALN
jgi:hypothetical protein